MQNINRVILTANLTKDPELITGQSGGKVCRMRVATNSRIKRGDAWEDKANYFDVVCFGKQAENVAQYMEKGRPIAIDGRLDFQEWEKDGVKRSAVQIIADTVQFLSDQRQEDGGGQGEATAVTAAPDDDDIPF